ncbi:MAG: transposase [Rubritalea sp.]|uniref:transposase n=1 Tax=Rubritalea sp. TaxID=2109375 RepID=UPI003241CF11
MKRRRKFSAEFKSKVAIEALREQLPIHEIAKKYQIHPSQVTDWKKALVGGAGEVFESSKAKTDQRQLQKRKEDRLFRQIGQLQTEVDFLKESCEILGVDLPENELNQ